MFLCVACTTRHFHRRGGVVLVDKYNSFLYSHLNQDWVLLYISSLLLLSSSPIIIIIIIMIMMIIIIIGSTQVSSGITTYRHNKSTCRSAHMSHQPLHIHSVSPFLRHPVILLQQSQHSVLWNTIRSVHSATTALKYKLKHTLNKAHWTPSMNPIWTITQIQITGWYYMMIQVIWDLMLCKQTLKFQKDCKTFLFRVKPSSHSSWPAKPLKM